MNELIKLTSTEVNKKFIKKETNRIYELVYNSIYLNSSYSKEDCEHIANTVSELFNTTLNESIKKYNELQSKELIELLMGSMKEDKNKKSKSFKTYLAHSHNDIYKIGKTSQENIEKRINEIQSPYKLQIVAVCSKDVENELHKKYHSKRLNGEYFKLSYEDIQDIKFKFEKLNIMKID